MVARTRQQLNSLSDSLPRPVWDDGELCTCPIAMVLSYLLLSTVKRSHGRLLRVIRCISRWLTESATPQSQKGSTTSKQTDLKRDCLPNETRPTPCTRVLLPDRPEFTQEVPYSCFTTSCHCRARQKSSINAKVFTAQQDCRTPHNRFVPKAPYPATCCQAACIALVAHQ